MALIVGPSERAEVEPVIAGDRGVVADRVHRADGEQALGVVRECALRGVARVEHDEARAIAVSVGQMRARSAHVARELREAVEAPVDVVRPEQREDCLARSEFLGSLETGEIVVARRGGVAVRRRRTSRREGQRDGAGEDGCEGSAHDGPH